MLLGTTVTPRKGLATAEQGVFMSHEQPKISARKGMKREGPLRIPLLFEEVISDVLKVKPERKPAINKRKKGTRV
jgi:hypothetical protein